MQHLGWVRHGEQGAGVGMARTQGRVADLVALVRRGTGLELADAALDALVVAEDLCDSQGSGFVNYVHAGFSAWVREGCWVSKAVLSRLTSICHDSDLGLGQGGCLARH